MMMFAQYGGPVHVVVEHQTQLARGVERHRGDVHAFVGQ